MSEDGKIICKRCKGKGEFRVRFYYKKRAYYYYSKCGLCYAKGYIDWVEAARGRKPGIQGYYIDCHPAGSACIDGTEDQIMGGHSVYDGHNYISVDTERGEALWYELITKEEGDE